MRDAKAFSRTVSRLGAITLYLVEPVVDDRGPFRAVFDPLTMDDFKESHNDEVSWNVHGGLGARVAVFGSSRGANSQAAR
jgi:hypothetical protein